MSIGLLCPLCTSCHVLYEVTSFMFLDTPILRPGSLRLTLLTPSQGPPDYRLYFRLLTYPQSVSFLTHVVQISFPVFRLLSSLTPSRTFYNPQRAKITMLPFPLLSISTLPSVPGLVLPITLGPFLDLTRGVRYL